MSNADKYRKYLSEIPDFLKAADMIYNKFEYNRDEVPETFHKISSYVTSPVIVSYTLFILKECIERKIKRIYFLARDGMILFKIAEIICKKLNIDIECRYIYCSRMSLRMPTYHFIGDEAYDILLMRGFNLSAYNVLMRAEMSGQEREIVYNDIEFDSENENNAMSRDEFNDFSAKLRKSEIYRNIVNEKSEKAYKSAAAYLNQEGFMDGQPFAIADTGWTGSMQKSLSQIISYYTGKNTSITGFYFGMFSRPQSEEFGEYVNWYFSHQSPVKFMSKFCNNLFECMCSAGHGMTTGYRIENDISVPLFNEASAVNAVLAEHQINSAMEFTENIMENFSDIFGINEYELHRMTERLIIRLMYTPEHEEAEALSNFIFCDDITECYSMKLADTGKETELRNCLISERISALLSHRHLDNELFWSYGSLALSDIPNKSWYRLNIYIWNNLRFLLSRYN